MPQRFLVPQFIEIEARIFGPVTVRQFIIMLISGMLDFIIYRLFLFNTFIVFFILNTLLFGMIAFLKVNGQPFHFFFLNFVETLRRPQLRVWRKVPIEKIKKQEEMPEKEEIFTPKERPTASRLSKLSLIVDTGGAYEGADVLEKNNKNSEKTENNS